MMYLNSAMINYSINKLYYKNIQGDVNIEINLKTLYIKLTVVKSYNR